MTEYSNTNNGNNELTLALLELRSSTTDANLIECINFITKPHFNKDEDFQYRKIFDMLVKLQQMTSTEADVIYQYIFSTPKYDDDISIILSASNTILSNTRQRPIKRYRLQWDLHVKLFCSENKFRNMYRMNVTSFNKLLKLIEGDLCVNQVKSKNRTSIDSLCPAVRLGCAIRYLAGGSHYDISTYDGISICAFFPMIYRVMKAICECKELSIEFPKKMNACEKAAAGFKNKSQGGNDGQMCLCCGWLALPYSGS